MNFGFWPLAFGSLLSKHRLYLLVRLVEFILAEFDEFLRLLEAVGQLVNIEFVLLDL